MSRRSVRLQIKNGNSSIQKVHMTRSKNRQSQCTSVTVHPHTLIETPHKDLELARDSSRVRGLKSSPLPCLSWGHSEDVWINMLNKDSKYVHDKNLIKRHPNLQPKMRSILLDWLQEVSEEYTFHRETFYLAQDFFDRFMLTQDGIDKTRLQLIGITALFIASKIEETYPPKVQDFAYLTDGTCLDKEIQQMELIILQALNWELRPETVITWLKLYMQVACLKEDSSVLVPQFSQEMYTHITQLLDVCILDINSLDYQYGVLAAAAFCHFTSFEVAQSASGVKQEVLADCVNWMAPFMRIVSQSHCSQLRASRGMCREDGYNIQTHVDYLAMLNDVQKSQLNTVSKSPPVLGGGMLTPPRSTEKQPTN